MKQVSMYTLSTCPWCRKTKKYFTDHKIQFKYVDYDLASVQEQEKIEQEMRSRGGPLSFPWVLIGDDLVVGWNPAKYEELLAMNKAS
jgi:glutaredoxin